MNRDWTSKICFLWVMTLFLPAGGPAGAAEPTHLEPAEEVTPHAIEIEEELGYVDSDDGFVKAETEISYGLNRRLKLGISAPFEHEDGEGTEFGDAGVFVEGVLNPDSEQRLLVGGQLDVLFPTGRSSEHLGGEIQLRMSKYLGEEGDSGFHLNLFGYLDTDEHEHKYDKAHVLRPYRWIRNLRHGRDDDKDDDMDFGAAVGYTHAATARTALVADAYYRQDYEGADDAVMGELGVSHNVTDAFSVGLGIGAGLTSESPDFEARLTFSYAFGGK